MTLTELRLRQTLDALAERVEPAPDAFARAHRDWRRRDRRRRLVAVVLSVLLVAGADVVGLWALERSTPPGPGVLFDGPAPAQPLPEMP